MQMQRKYHFTYYITYGTTPLIYITSSLITTFTISQLFISLFDSFGHFFHFIIFYPIISNYPTYLLDLCI